MTALDLQLEAFQPYLADDDGSLVTFLTALTLGYEVVDQVVRDTDDGPGWSILLDVERAPAWALRWLGQFTGTRIAPGSPEAASRQAIRTPAGWRRGTPQAIIDAVRPTLTGTQTVLILERDTDEYALTVATYTTETPDTAATTAAALSQKPGGLQMTVITTDPHTWATLVAHRATWTATVAAFSTWADVVAGA